jgi:PRTRC genetic system protein B
MIHLSLGFPPPALQLKKALLIYEPNGYNHSPHTPPIIMTLHHVTHHENSPPTLEAGIPADPASIRAALDHLAPNRNSSGWIHPRLLFTHPKCRIWWLKSHRRTIPLKGAFSSYSHRPLLHPNLVFCVRKGHLSVFAIKGPPSPSSPLFMAPYPNVGADGSVCLGNNPKPTKHTPEKWEELFFETNFTHTNATKLCLGNPNDLFKTISNPKTKRFPTSKLLPLNIKLENLVERL